MNCNDVQRILNGATSSSGAAEHQGLRAHLAACAGCKEEWEAQELFAALPVSPASAPLLELAQRALEVPRASARTGGMRLSAIVGGTLLVAAAAAAVIVGTQPDPATFEPLTIERSPAFAEPTRSSTPEPSESAASSNVAAPADERGAGAQTGLAADSPINLDPSWIAVLPLPAGAASEDVMAAVEERRAEIVRRIAETDGLYVVDDGLVRSYVNAGMADTEIGRSLGARVVMFPHIERRDGAVLIRFYKLDPATDWLIVGPEYMYVDREAQAAGVDAARFARHNELVWSNNLSVTLDAIVRDAYPQLAPSDEQLAAENRAALLNTNLDREERIRALRYFRGTRLDRVVIDAGIALLQSADEPQVRRRILFALRGADDPSFVQLLVRTLAYDTSSAVRLDAAKMLARFSDDEAVRNALEIAEANDEADAVREAAAVAKLSQDERIELRRETFLNRDLPTMTRIMELNIGIVDSTKGPALRVDQEIGRELVEIAVNGASNDERAMALTVLYYVPSSSPDFDLNPALREPLLALLNHDPEPTIRGSAALALRLFADEPDVREALESARDNDPVRQIRNNAGRALELTR